MNELGLGENVLRGARFGKLSWLSSALFDVVHPLLVLIATVLITAVCCGRGLAHLYTWHVLLTGLGFHLLMATGISMLYGGNGWARQSTRATRTTVHWILQTVGSACALTGTVLQYIGRERKQKAHFVSAHSIVGMLAVILVCLSLGNGLAALFGWKLRRFIRPSLAKLMHHAAGAACFALGMCAIALAYENHIFKEIFSHQTRIGFVLVTALTAAISLSGVWKNIYNALYETVTGCRSTEYILDGEDE